MFGHRSKQHIDAQDVTEKHSQSGNYLIDLQQITKTYQSAAGPFTALRAINLQVNSGEFVAVIGKSGSGKSTLLNMITGIDCPTSGEIIVGGVAIHTMNEEQITAWRGRALGIVFQFFQLIPTLTVLENVKLPMDFCRLHSKPDRHKRAMNLLERMEIAQLAHKLPLAISGGEQQRVAIARALANDPPIVVADEPTGNLDSKTATSVFQLLEDLVEQGKTVLMVTHDLDMAKQAGRTITLTDGKIIDESGGGPSATGPN